MSARVKMSRKPKTCPVSSTPHPQRMHNLFALFEDLGLSPIESSQLKVPSSPQPKLIPQSIKPGVAKKTGAKRKRQTSTEKASPVRVSEAVMKELGVKAEDVCNNALSQSRNLYNMFPQPIILDSDEEETMLSAVSAKKPLKKSRHESKNKDAVDGFKTENNKCEDKINQAVPGSSRNVRLTRLAINKERQTKTSSQSSKSSSSNVKESKCRPKKNGQPRNQPIPDSSPGVIVLDDEDNISINIFSDLNKTETDLSDDLEEKVPIQWSQRQQKVDRVGNKPNEVPVIKNSERSEILDIENNKCEVLGSDNIKKCEKAKNVKISNRKNKTEMVKSKKVLANGAVTKSCGNNMKNNLLGVDIAGACEEKELPPGSICRFKDVKFKFNNNCEAIMAQCLKTESHDVGYLEVSPEKTFSGQRSKVTFVVLEGRALVTYLGISKKLSVGDMIHISEDSGYQLNCVGGKHVRFLYCKGH